LTIDQQSRNMTAQDVLDIADVRSLALSYLDIRSLRLFGASTRRYLADTRSAVNDRTVRVTQDDVVHNRHVTKLRALIRSAEAGQTIRLAPGRYVLGDETVPGHCAETIEYDDEGREAGEYYCDIHWNEWRKDYGPIVIGKPGLRIIGPDPSVSDARRQESADGEVLASTEAEDVKEETTRAVFFLKATWWFSAESNAFHVRAGGIHLENLVVEKECRAIVVGSIKHDEQYEQVHGQPPSHWPEWFKGVPKPSSAIIANCLLRGSLRVCANCECTVSDCVIEDDPGGADGKASVRLSPLSTARLERTAIRNSGRLAFEAHYNGTGWNNITSGGSQGYGGLWLGDRSTVHLTEVVVSGCVPAGIVVSSRKARIVLCGRVSFLNNSGGIMKNGGRGQLSTVYGIMSIHCPDSAETAEMKNLLESNTRTRVYPNQNSDGANSVFKYKNEKSTSSEDSDEDCTVAQKNIDSANQVLFSDGTTEGNACLEALLEQITTTELSRQGIADNTVEALKHHDGYCPNDCSICRWDFEFPAWTIDSYEVSMNWYTEKDKEMMDEKNGDV